MNSDNSLPWAPKLQMSTVEDQMVWNELVGCAASLQTEQSHQRAELSLPPTHLNRHPPVELFTVYWWVRMRMGTMMTMTTMAAGLT